MTEKRERRRGTLIWTGCGKEDGEQPEGIETFDDDPADWDELLRAIDELIEPTSNPMMLLRRLDAKLTRIVEARQPKRGER